MGLTVEFSLLSKCHHLEPECAAVAELYFYVILQIFLPIVSW